MNSQELLQRIEAGDSQAAAAVFDRYVARLLALARVRVGPKLAQLPQRFDKIPWAAIFSDFVLT